MSASAQIIGSEDLREVRLYGHLGKRFGRVHRVAVKTCHEATQALAAVLVGFAKYMTDHSEPGYHVFAGRIHKSTNLGIDLIDAPLAKGEAVFIVPAVAGAKNGTMQIIVGLVLIAVGVFTAQGWSVQIGVGLTLGGVLQVLTPMQKGGDEVKPDNLPSYHYDGPVNSTQQGLPVQLVYGQMIIGSAVISQGISSTDLAI